MCSLLWISLSKSVSRRYTTDTYRFLARETDPLCSGSSSSFGALHKSSPFRCWRKRGKFHCIRVANAPLPVHFNYHSQTCPSTFKIHLQIVCRHRIHCWKREKPNFKTFSTKPMYSAFTLWRPSLFHCCHEIAKADNLQRPKLSSLCYHMPLSTAVDHHVICCVLCLPPIFSKRKPYNTKTCSRLQTHSLAIHEWGFAS